MNDSMIFLTIIGAPHHASSNIDYVNSLQVRLNQADPGREYSLRRAPLPNGESGCCLLVDVDGVQFTVVLRPDRIEPGTYASAVAAATLTWKDARISVDRAKEQIIIAANHRAADHEAAVKVAFLLTIVTNVIACEAGSEFIYWGTGDLLVEPSTFAVATEGMLRKNRPPLLQWVQFDLFRGPDSPAGSTGGMRSKGLVPFLGYELELDPVAMSPVEIARRAIGYAEHLIREGTVEEADEIDGPAAGERIRFWKEDRGNNSVLRMRVKDVH